VVARLSAGVGGSTASANADVTGVPRLFVLPMGVGVPRLPKLSWAVANELMVATLVGREDVDRFCRERMADAGTEKAGPKSVLSTGVDVESGGDTTAAGSTVGELGPWARADSAGSVDCSSTLEISSEESADAFGRRSSMLVRRTVS
jgi:hypothetical protein